MISIALEQNIVAAGSCLHGQLTYPETNIPKQITVALHWYTEGRGTRDSATVHTLDLVPQDFDAGYPVTFSFDIPGEGPVTYNGSLLRILWEVKATLKYPGLRLKKEKITEPFSVICR